ncbi:hypothetical protein PYCC9005_004143 [Savitreella phatthalungensis]
MFDLFPDVAMPPIRREKSKDVFRLGKDRGLPPDLEGDAEDYLVELTSDTDPANAKNWPFKRKAVSAAVLGFDTLIATWGSSSYSSSLQGITMAFGVGQTVAILGITLYILGFALGPLVFAPLSELYGRKPPIVIACFVFVCFEFAIATAENFQTLMLCRFFAGVAASCPLAVVGGAFTDMFDTDLRGSSIALFASLVFAGPFLSPLVSTAVVQATNWRWSQYLTAFMGCLALVLDIVFYEETYQKAILVKRAKEIRQHTHNWAIHHSSEEEVIDFKDLVEKHLLLPLKLLFTEPALLLISIYLSFVYSLIYLNLELIPIIFTKVRGYGPIVTDLFYIPAIIGVFIGAGITISLEPRYNRKVKAMKGFPQPRERLIPMQIGGISFCIGLFWLITGDYTWISWLSPAFALIFVGIGLLLIFLAGLNYIIDMYLMYAASAIAGNTFIRSFMAAAFPLFAFQMFAKLTVTWGAFLLGGIALVLAPVPTIFYIFDERIRGSSKYAPAPDIKFLRKQREEQRDKEASAGRSDSNDSD